MLEVESKELPLTVAPGEPPSVYTSAVDGATVFAYDFINLWDQPIARNSVEMNKERITVNSEVYMNDGFFTRLYKWLGRKLGFDVVSDLQAANELDPLTGQIRPVVRKRVIVDADSQHVYTGAVRYVTTKDERGIPRHWLDDARIYRQRAHWSNARKAMAVLPDIFKVAGQAALSILEMIYERAQTILVFFLLFSLISWALALDAAGQPPGTLSPFTSEDQHGYMPPIDKMRAQNTKFGVATIFGFFGLFILIASIITTRRKYALMVVTKTDKVILNMLWVTLGLHCFALLFGLVGSGIIADFERCTSANSKLLQVEGEELFNRWERYTCQSYFGVEVSEGDGNTTSTSKKPGFYGGPVHTEHSTVDPNDFEKCRDPPHFCMPVQQASLTIFVLFSLLSFILCLVVCFLILWRIEVRKFVYTIITFHGDWKDGLPITCTLRRETAELLQQQFTQLQRQLAPHIGLPLGLYPFAGKPVQLPSDVASPFPVIDPQRMAEYRFATWAPEVRKTRNLRETIVQMPPHQPAVSPDPSAPPASGEVTIQPMSGSTEPQVETMPHQDPAHPPPYISSSALNDQTKPADAPASEPLTSPPGTVTQ